MVQKSQATTVWMVLKPCKSWDKLPFPQLVGRISSINRRTLSVWSTNIKTLEVERLTPEKWMFFFVPADSGFLFGFRYILLGVNLLLNFQASQNYDPKIKISKCRSKYVKIMYNYPVIYHALSIWNGACFPQQNLALIHPSLHHPKVPYNNSIIFMTKKTHHWAIKCYQQVLKHLGCENSLRDQLHLTSKLTPLLIYVVRCQTSLKCFLIEIVWSWAYADDDEYQEKSKLVLIVLHQEQWYLNIYI